MDKSFRIADAISVLPSSLTVPGLGLVPVNAYLIRSKAPVLVDTGLHADSDAFMHALRSEIEPRDLRWIWLTHTDQDHVGSLQRVLDEAPQARIVTNFLGAGKLGLFLPVPPHRLHFLNPGQSLDVGDRLLTAVRPPVYDAPETTGLHDSRSGAFFSSDCFGAVLPQAVRYARDVTAATLAEGQVLWATIDAPWIHDVEKAALARGLDQVRRMAPGWVLGSHLPPAAGMVEPLLDALASAQPAAPFLGPDQAAFEDLLRQAA